MMKKWYFSENGKVSGPHSIDNASAVLSNNNNMYGWTPSFSQWLPVNQIPELSELLPESKPSPQVSKILIDKFVAKRRDLNKKVTLIDNAIKERQTQIEAFEKEISQYKSLTESLPSNMKDNISPIEKKHQLASKQLRELIKATEIAKHEMVGVIQGFGELVLSKTTENLDELLELKALPELQQIEENAKTQATVKKTPEPEYNRIPDVLKTTTSSEVSQNINNKNKKTTIEKVVALKASAEKTSADSTKEALPLNTLQTSTDENTAFVGVKNKFKSVFKPTVADGKATIKKVVALKASVKSKMEKPSPDSPQEPVKDKVSIGESIDFKGVKNKLKSVFKSKAEAPAMKLSDQLKQLEQHPNETLPFADSDIHSNLDGNLLDNNNHNTKRRRRRRS